MSCLKKSVKENPVFFSFKPWNLPRQDGSRETGLIPDESIRLGRHRPSRCFLRRRSRALASLAASNHQHVARDCDVHSRGEAIDSVSVHRKPTSRIEQVAGFIANGRQLQTLYRTIVRTVEDTGVVES